MTSLGKKATSYSCGKSRINMNRICKIEGLKGQSVDIASKLKSTIAASKSEPEAETEADDNDKPSENNLDNDLELELDGDDLDMEAFKERFEAGQTAKVGDNTVQVQATSKENLSTSDADNLNQKLYVYVHKTFDKRKANIQGGQDAKIKVVDSINIVMAQVLDNVAEGDIIAYEKDGKITPYITVEVDS